MAAPNIEHLFGGILAILGLAGGAILTALAIKYATDSRLWDIVLWGGVTLSICSVASLALLWSAYQFDRPLLMPAILINLAICLAVAGVLLHLSPDGFSREKGTTDKISIEDLSKIAANNGWTFSASTKHWMDFNSAIKDAALNRKLQVWGRPMKYKEREANLKNELDKIPALHWADHQIYAPMMGAMGGNYKVYTQTLPIAPDEQANPRSMLFIDLQFEQATAKKWIDEEAFQYRGQNK